MCKCACALQTVQPAGLLLALTCPSGWPSRPCQTCLHQLWQARHITRDAVSSLMYHACLLNTGPVALSQLEPMQLR